MLYSPQIVNGDEVRSVTNSGYELVSGRDKVRQDIHMILTTNTRRTTGLGAQLDDLVGKDAENPALAYANTPFMFELQMRVKTSMDRLKAAQRRYQFSYRVPAELIHDFSQVQIWPLKADPRNYRWQLDIQTMDGRAGSIRGSMVF